MLNNRRLAMFGLSLALACPLWAQIPAPAADRFQEALELFQRQHFPAAHAIISQLRKEFPQNFDILHLSAILLDLSGRAEEANQEFARAVALNPGSDRARTNLGVSSLRLGRLEQAMEQFRAAFELNPSNATAAFNLGVAFLQRQQVADSEKWFEKAYQLQPEVYQNGYQLALSRFLLADHAGSARVLLEIKPRVPEGALEFQLLEALNQRALSGPEVAASSIGRLVSTLQTRPQSIPGVIDLFLAQGLLPEAEKLLESATGQAPADSLWLKLAEVRLGLGKPDAALEAIDRIQAGPFQARAHLLRGDVLESMDRSIEALEQYRQAVHLEPSDITYFSLGYELLSHWNWPEAETVFEGAVRLFPDSWRLWLGLGTAQWGQGKGEQSTVSLLRAVALNPDETTIYASLARAFDQATDSFPRAVEEFRRYQARNSKEPWALYYRALAEVELSKREGSPPPLDTLAGWLEEASRGGSAAAPAQLLLGELHFENREWEKAVTAFDRALALDPEQVEARYKLGLALQRSGSRDRAVEELKRYQEQKAALENAVEERTARTRKFIIEMKKPQ